MRKYFVKFIFMLLLTFLMGAVLTVQAAPEDSYVLQVEGTYYYSKAYEMLPYINEEREKLGLNSLSMDPELMSAAMQRAAECAVDFDHTRPDGTSCFSICSKMRAENIAAGRSTAKSTFEQWMNSPGHKANMMNSSYSSIGIGCFAWGNLHYWVQVFSMEAAGTGSQLTDCRVSPSVLIREGAYGIGFNLNYGNRDYILNVGDTMTLYPGRDNPGWDLVYCQFTGGSFTWASSNPAVAAVDAEGNVHAQSVGDVTITAKPKNGTGEGGSVKVSCRRSIKDAVISEIPSVTYCGQSYTPEVDVSVDGKKLSLNEDYTVEYYNNTKAGTASISIYGTGDYTGSTSASFRILPLDISKDVQYRLCGWDSEGYDTPVKCIEDMLDVIYKGSKLKCGTDYYINGVSTSGSSTKVSGFGVSLKGNYTGFKEFTSLERGFLKPIGTQYFTGQEIIPELHVFLSDYEARYYPENELVVGKDYDAQITGNVQEGTASIKITGKDCYYGSFSGSFEIEKYRQPVTDAVFSPIASAVYSGNPYTPEVTVSLNGKKLIRDIDYTVSYSNNIDAGKARVTITGKGEYRGTASTVFQILPLDISKQAQYRMNGWDSSCFDEDIECVEAMLDVTYNGQKMECGEDYYIISCGSNPETKAITYFGISFMKNYTGSSYFYSLENGYMKPVITQIYTGKPVTPTIHVYASEYDVSHGSELIKGQDYDIQFSGNVDAGIANVVITGKGQYYGTFKGTFKIINPASPKPVNRTFTAKLNKAILTYSGKSQQPSVWVMDGKKRLKQGVNYTLTYSKNKNVGIGSVTVKGKGIYAKVSKKLTFKIIPKKMSVSSAVSSRKNMMVVKWKKNSQASGYQIQISTKKNFLSDVSSYTVKKNSICEYICKKLKSKKTYYVRIRAYKKLSGKTLYGKWSSSRSVKIK